MRFLSRQARYALCVSITHEEQRACWNKEHKTPFAIPQMDAEKGSSCLFPFYDFLREQQRGHLVGLEMGCGKGRNVLWLAKQPLIAQMHGFDFSDVAIAEAKRRAMKEGLMEKTEFTVMDATKPWTFDSASIDFVVDCTASTDIESSQGRAFAVDEVYRVLQHGGYVLVYVMSTDDEYHAMMIEESPAQERNAFIHPQTGKFEKVFSGSELDSLYRNFRLLDQRRIAKTVDFFGTSYACQHHWRIYQKDT